MRELEWLSSEGFLPAMVIHDPLKARCQGAVGGLRPFRSESGPLRPPPAGPARRRRPRVTEAGALARLPRPGVRGCMIFQTSAALCDCDAMASRALLRRERGRLVLALFRPSPCHRTGGRGASLKKKSLEKKMRQLLRPRTRLLQPGYLFSSVQKPLVSLQPG